MNQLKKGEHIFSNIYVLTKKYLYNTQKNEDIYSTQRVRIAKKHGGV